MRVVDLLIAWLFGKYKIEQRVNVPYIEQLETLEDWGLACDRCASDEAFGREIASDIEKAQEIMVAASTRRNRRDAMRKGRCCTVLFVSW